jgi:predicted CoA-substrate-specific enzyme activase
MRKDKPVLGIDLGSRTTKIVKFDKGKVESFEIFDTNHNAIQKVRETIRDSKYSKIVATGYGRHLMRAHLSTKVITEIKACAKGAKFLNPDCRLVVDIGGQDSKVIEINPERSFGQFEMNDRCAAGTGRFLEVMAQVLGYGIEDFWREALAAKSPLPISSMCTVFAESEVISLMTSGEDRRRIALGLHLSVIDRLYPMISRFEYQGGAMFVGGVAKNRCIVELLKKKLRCDILVPENPQLVSAIGSALIAYED